MNGSPTTGETLRRCKKLVEDHGSYASGKIKRLPFSTVKTRAARQRAYANKRKVHR